MRHERRRKKRRRRRRRRRREDEKSIDANLCCFHNIVIFAHESLTYVQVISQIIWVEGYSVVQVWHQPTNSAS